MMNTQKTVLALALSAAFAQPVQAANKYWVCGSAYWDTTCWSDTAGGAATLGQPVNGDNAYLVQGDPTNRTVYYWNTAYPSAVLNALTIDAAGGIGTISLSQTKDPLAATVEYIGYYGTGSFTQSGGTNTVNTQLVLGGNIGSNGAYTLSGTGSLTAAYEYVGYWGTGSFTQSGGTNTVSNTLYLGTNSNSNGTYILSGTGSLTAGYEYIGQSGTGSFTQSGGTNTVNTQLVLGGTIGSNGTYTLMSGTLMVAGNIVKGSGSGTLNIDGGSLSVGGGNGSINVGTLVLGSTAGSSGIHTLSGTGSLTAANEYIGNFGTGSITQSGGTNTVSNTLYLGTNSNSNGTYILSGTGSLTAGYEYIGQSGTGSFTQSGGTNTVNTQLVLGGTIGSNGTYTLMSGTLTVAGNIVKGSGSGTLNIDGGSLSVGGGNGSINVGTLVLGSTAGSSGIHTLSGTGSISAANVTIGAAGSGYLTQSGGTLTASNLTINDTYAFNGGSLEVNGSLNNNGIFTIAGGTISGNGTLVNNAFVSGFGTIGSSGGFTNNAFVTQSGGNLILSNTGANANYGNMDLATGYQLRLNGASLDNGGTINLNNAVVAGTGTLNNTYGGVIAGRGIISSNFSNSGGVVAVTSGTTRITQAFSSSGAIQLGGPTASLTGGAITNTGTIEGVGSVGNSITNTGIVRAGAGTLTLSGVSVSNNAGGLMTASSGGTILVANSMSSNAGVINLNGGAFDSNNHAMGNTGQISGYGTLRTGGLTNSGSMTLTGGTTTINGNVTNGAGGKLEVAHNPAIFTGDVVNNGIVKTTNTTVTFAGTYMENGVFVSDPSNNYFTNVVIGTNGYWTGGVGDNFYVSGNFENYSLQNTLWNTNGASLILNGTSMQNVYLAGNDLGALVSGYGNNFAWGEFSLVAGTSVKLWDGNSDPGAALYVGLVELGGGISQLSSIDSPYNIYYDANLAGNAYLGGQTYALNGGGSLMAAQPVPEAKTYAMMLAGLGLMGVVVRRRQQVA